MIGNRRKAREAALQLLYQDEYHDPETRVLAERHFWEEFDLVSGGDEVRSFARFLVDGVRERREKLDEQIASVARNWKVERMSRVDRNILRAAGFELMFASDIPRKVTLNEAIEVAKIYGTEDSSAFINGVLDRISRELRNSDPTPNSPAVTTEEAP